MFQPLKREAASLACCARSIAWEADKSNAFRESHFWGVFGRKQCGHPLPSFFVMPPVECSDNLCSDSQSLRLSESSSVYTRNSTVSAGGGPPTVSTLLTQFAHSG